MPRGGKREGAGRKALGTTRKCSLTLENDTWEKLDKYLKRNNLRLSAYLRTLVEDDQILRD